MPFNLSKTPEKAQTPHINRYMICSCFFPLALEYAKFLSPDLKFGRSFLRFFDLKPRLFANLHKLHEQFYWKDAFFQNLRIRVYLQLM